MTKDPLKFAKEHFIDKFNHVVKFKTYLQNFADYNKFAETLIKI